MNASLNKKQFIKYCLPVAGVLAMLVLLLGLAPIKIKADTGGGGLSCVGFGQTCGNNCNASASVSENSYSYLTSAWVGGYVEIGRAHV